MCEGEVESRAYATIKGPYNQRSARARIEAFFLDNVGLIATKEQVMGVSRNQKTGVLPWHWHADFVEFIHDSGYTICSIANRKGLKMDEYLMPTGEREADPLTQQDTKQDNKSGVRGVLGVLDLLSWFFGSGDG